MKTLGKPWGMAASRTPAPALALAVLCVAQFVDVLGVTVVIVALPAIAQDLEAQRTATQWVVSAYALSFGGLLLLSGRAADRFGRRRMFSAGMLAFGLASLACGLAPSVPVLIAARVAQGAAAAAVVPAALALLTATFPGGGERARALAVWTAAAAGGGAAGFLVGGLVTAAAGWRWVFLLNVPVALLTAALAGRVLGESRGERRRMHLRPTLRAVAGPAAIAAVLTATTGGAAVLITTHLQDVLGQSPAQTGLAFAPFSLLVAAGSLLGPRIIERIGLRGAISTGLMLVAVSMLLFTTAGRDSAMTPFVAGLAISGAGLGWASVAATAVGMGSAGDGEQGLAAGLLNTATQLGTAVGVAVLGAVAELAAAAHAGTGDAALVAGMRVGWVAAAVLATAAALAAACLMSRAGTRSLSGGDDEDRGLPELSP